MASCTNCSPSRGPSKAALPDEAAAFVQHAEFLAGKKANANGGLAARFFNPFELIIQGRAYLPRLRSLGLVKSVLQIALEASALWMVIGMAVVGAIAAQSIGSIARLLEIKLGSGEVEATRVVLILAATGVSLLAATIILLRAARAPLSADGNRLWSLMQDNGIQAQEEAGSPELH